MQKLIVRLNWSYYLFPIEALPYFNEICEVKEKSIGNVTHYYIDKEVEAIDLKLIVTNHLNIVDKGNQEMIEKDYENLVKSAKDDADYYRKHYLDAAKKVKELEEKLTSSLCKEEDVKCQN